MIEFIKDEIYVFDVPAWNEIFHFEYIRESNNNDDLLFDFKKPSESNFRGTVSYSIIELRYWYDKGYIKKLYQGLPEDMFKI